MEIPGTEHKKSWFGPCSATRCHQGRTGGSSRVLAIMMAVLSTMRRFPRAHEGSSSVLQDGIVRVHLLFYSIIPHDCLPDPGTEGGIRKIGRKELA